MYTFFGEKNNKKLPVFCHKIKTKTSIKILRHASLDLNVRNTHIKCQLKILCTYRDIHVQKIKVKKTLFNSYVIISH